MKRQFLVIIPLMILIISCGKGEITKKDIENYRKTRINEYIAKQEIECPSSLDSYELKKCLDLHQARTNLGVDIFKTLDDETMIKEMKAKGW